MKTLKILLIIVSILVIIPLLGFAGWLLKRGLDLDVLVVNKSMTEFKGSENYAINYILNSEKVLTPGNRHYKMDVDHIGLHWNDGDYKIKYPRLKEITRTVEKTDILYFADAKGINKSQIKELKEGEKDKLEYGGINNTDYTLIREMIKLKKPVVVESSFLGPPTESLVRYNLEQLKDVYYTGWKGKYVKNLSIGSSDGDCSHLANAYADITGEEWSFSGPGIVIVNEDVSRMLVLEEGIDIETKEGFIYTDEIAMERFDLPASVNYHGWFTILHPGNNDVLSTFKLSPTESGMEKLSSNGLHDSFPALIETANNFYYLAGDFGKCKVSLRFSRIIILNKLVAALKSNTRNPSNFFYTYYQPFMNQVIEDAKNIKDGN